jgi:hypothetical protein
MLSDHVIDYNCFIEAIIMGSEEYGLDGSYNAWEVYVFQRNILGKQAISSVATLSAVGKGVLV